MTTIAPPAPSSTLTPREVDCLQHIVDGCDTAEAAERLYIARSTVKNHLQMVYRKLGAHNRTQAVLIALRLGVVNLDGREAPVMNETLTRAVDTGPPPEGLTAEEWESFVNGWHTIPPHMRELVLTNLPERARDGARRRLDAVVKIRQVEQVEAVCSAFGMLSAGRQRGILKRMREAVA